MNISIQLEDFNVGLELKKFQQNNSVGAIVSFTGLVRGDDDFIALEIEHYPKMTKNSIAEIIKTAQSRWQIIDSLVIHRVGRLKLNQQIVLVIVSSKHRQDAFRACEFIMDYLKTKAQFWKKEISKSTTVWVNAKKSDDLATKKWQ